MIKKLLRKIMIEKLNDLTLKQLLIEGDIYFTTEPNQLNKLNKQYTKVTNKIKAIEGRLKNE